MVALLVACGSDARPPPPIPPPAPPPPMPSSGGGGGGGTGMGSFGSGTSPLPDVGGGGAGAIGRQVLEARMREREAAERAAGPQRLTSEGSLTREATVMRQAVTTTTPVFEDSDDTPCERGWRSFQAAQEAYAAEMGGTTRTAPLDAESRRSFLRQCQALPRAQQDCFDAEFRRAHVADCEEFSEAQQHRGERVARGARRHDTSTITMPADPPSASHRSSPEPD